MSQTRTRSLIEAKTNAAIGLVVSWWFTLYGLPLFGLTPTPSDAAGIAVAYFLLSAVRSYIVRRGFNMLENGKLHG